ncbi:MAG: efflux RND transporter permease subunit [Elusimicrobia bacterium]|nr:efflux RND transporter permease subunit [Elusimicrobiota bacterium]
MKLPDFSVKRPVAISMLVLIVVVLGLTALPRMGLDLMPDITFPILTVVTPYQGVSSEEIENALTRPIESAVAMTSNVSKINSISMEGLSVIMAEYSWGTQMEFAAQDVRDQLEMFAPMLPEDRGDTQIMKFDASMMPIGGWGITGDVSYEELRKICEDEIEPVIQQVPGVSAVYLFGGPEREIRVELEKDKLEALRIPPGLVVAQLASSNLNVPGGRIQEGYRELTVKGTGEFTSIDDLKNTLIANREGNPIYVSDLGEVLDTHKEVRSFTRTNSAPSIMIMAFKETSVNTVLVSGRVMKEMKKLISSLPGNIRYHTYLDQGDMIKQVLSVTLNSALWGGLLAILILFIFLRSWRPTVVIATAIPLSLLATFLPLYAAGYTINFVVLIGVALGVGMIVDSSIVVIENSFRQLGITGDPKLASAIGAKQVGMAITASTFTTVVVFIPLLFAGGVVGRIFTQLAITVTSALICSLIVALTIIPMLGSKLFKVDTSFAEPKWQVALNEKYRKLLEYAMERKKKVAIFAGLVVLISILAFPFMPREYFPSMEMAFMSLDIKRGIGTPIEETDRLVKIVEEALEGQEGIVSYSGMVGAMDGGGADSAIGTGPSGPHEASFFISLKPLRERSSSEIDIKNTIRRAVPEIEDGGVEFMDMGQAMMGGGQAGSPIQIKVYGPDIDTLREITDSIRDKISKVAGVVDASTTLEAGSPEYTFAINRAEASRLGYTTSEIAGSLGSVRGMRAGNYREKGKEYPISVILRESDRDTVRNISQVPVFSNTGGVISLGEVTEARETVAPVRLEREDRRRVVTVTANYEGIKFSRVHAGVQRAIDTVRLPPGYTLDYGGEAEDLNEMFTTLMQLFLLAILFIYMVMAAQFESFVQPLMIMATIPLAWVGVVWLLLLTGKSISMPSGMGILILFGIVVNNAIVLIDYINQLRRDMGMKIREAVLEASSVRLRPILMTSATTVMGMVPMAISRMEGAEISSVVSIAIIGGLVAGTILTLFVIPLLYDTVESHFEKKKGATT